MGERGKPAGRIIGGTVSVSGAIEETVKETISVDDTELPQESHDGDFLELRPVDRSNYKIGDEIARGGMGSILEARDRRTGRPLAIKEVRTDVMTRSPAAVRAAVIRFRREAILTAQLQHPSIIPVYEIGRFGQVPFIAMKRVSGTPLDRRIDECTNRAERLALLPRLIAVAEAIAYAHSESVVHRDIKPANVLLGDFGETIVIDWGLAKRSSEPDGDLRALQIEGDLQTVAGAVFGTPQYMAPEQAEGESAGSQTDVYALGALLYEVLTGEAPYTSELAKEEHVVAQVAIDLVRGGPPPSILELEPATPTDLVSIAEKAMARECADRYETAAQFVADLQAFERGQLVGVHDYSSLDLLKRWVSRHRAVVLTATLLLVLGAASTTWFVTQNIAARDEARNQERRASAELLKAMTAIRDRGFDELKYGNLRRAASALATAYPYLDDYPLRVALGELARGLESQRDIIIDSRTSLTDLDHVSGRLALTKGNETHIVDLDGAELFTLVSAGDKPRARFANSARSRGAKIVTSELDALVVWNENGEVIRRIEIEGLSAWDASRDGDVVAALAPDALVAYRLSTGEQLARVVVPLDARAFAQLELNHAGSHVLLSGPKITLVDLKTGLVKQRQLRRTGANAIGALSPDGKLFAIGVEAGLVRVFRSDTGADVIPEANYERTVGSMQFADGSAMLVTLDVDGGLCFSELSSQRIECDLDAKVTSLDVIGDIVATGHSNGSVTIWDAHGVLISRIPAHSDGKTLARLVDSGTKVVTSGFGNELRTWNVVKPTGDAMFRAPEKQRIRYLPPYVFSRQDNNRWTFFDLTDPGTVFGLNGLPSEPPTPSANGEIVVSGTTVWRRASNSVTTSTHLASATQSAVSPDGASVLTCNKQGILSLIDISSDQVRWQTSIASLEVGPPEYAVRVFRFSPSGDKIAVSVTGTDVIIAASDGAKLATLAHGPKTGAGELSSRVVFIRNEERFVSLRLDALTLWSASGLHLVGEASGGAVAVSPSANHVIIAAGSNIGRFGATDTANIEWFTRGDLTRSPIRALAVSKRGLIAAASMDGRLQVFDGTGRLITRRLSPNTRSLSFTDDERLVADSGGVTRVWSLASITQTPAQMAALIESTMSSQP